MPTTVFYIIKLVGCWGSGIWVGGPKALHSILLWRGAASHSATGPRSAWRSVRLHETARLAPVACRLQPRRRLHRRCGSGTPWCAVVRLLCREFSLSWRHRLVCTTCVQGTTKKKKSRSTLCMVRCQTKKKSRWKSSTVSKLSSCAFFLALGRPLPVWRAPERKWSHSTCWIWLNDWTVWRIEVLWMGSSGKIVDGRNFHPTYDLYAASS